MANNIQNIDISKKQSKIILARYIYPVLPLSGLIILSGVILVHILQMGASLSSIEKYIYFFLILMAGIFILGGIWVKIPAGVSSIARLINVGEDSIIETRQHRHFIILEFLAVLGAFITIFLFSMDAKIAVYNLDAARFFNDTPGYLRTGSYPLTDSNFRNGERPFTLPLLYKMAGYTLQNYSDQGEMEHVARIQLVISIITWALLALSVSLLLKKWVIKFLSFAIIEMVGASLSITMWDRLMLSDSLSISLFALFFSFLIFAAWIWRRNTSLPVWMQILLVFSIIVIAALYSFTRDPNAYYLLSLGALLMFGLLFRSVRDHKFLPGYMMTMLSFFAIYGVQSSIRVDKTFYVQTLSHVFVYRFIPDTEKLSFLVKNGMPYDQQYSSYPELNLGQLYDLLFIDQPTGLLTTWIKDHGKVVLFKYMISHPYYTFVAPLADLQAMVSGDVTSYRKTLSPTPSRLSILNDIFYPRYAGMPILFLIFFGISIFLAYKNNSSGFIVILILVLFITSVPFLLLVWHSDPNDLTRHALQAALQLRMASWLCILLLIERVWIFVDKILSKGGTKDVPAIFGGNEV